MYKEPKKLHDPKLEPRIKRAFVTFELKPDHYLKEFMPAWKKYVLWGNVVVAVWVSLCLTLYFVPSVMKSLFGIWIFLMIASLASGLYFTLKLECPKCQCNVIFIYYQWPRKAFGPHFILTGECPSCGVKLKNRLLSDEAITLVRVLGTIGIALVMLVIFIFMIIRYVASP